MSRKLMGAVVGAALFGMAPANAATMWVVENQSDQVFRIDTTTWAATLVGSAGVNLGFGGLGFDTSGVLYASTTVSTYSLYTVNQSTGVFTLVGTSSLSGADTFDIHPLTNTGIAMRVLGTVHTINLATGGQTLRSTLSAETTETNSAFGPDGTYYAVNRGTDRLLRIDIDTGVVTDIGGLGIDVNGTNLSFNPDDGFLYMIGIQDATYPVYRIDASTGAASVVGNVTGLPDRPDQQITMATIRVAAVPEPATLAILGLGLAGLGIARRCKAA